MKVICFLALALAAHPPPSAPKTCPPSPRGPGFVST
jgi:hypothetical protein